MGTETSILLGTAVTIGFVHTVLGPDHYVPFIAMARARNWSHRKAMLITLLSGIGHVSSSAILGALGLLFGAELLKLTSLESVRGDIAGWMLLSFGLAYMVYGVRRALKKAPVTHTHEGIAHTHFGPREHVHDPGKANITPWVIFTIFVFGPCEPLIPLLMYPAARSDTLGVVTVALSFSVVCIGTMMTLVYASLRGLEWFPQKSTERYSHALAGFAVAACGAGVVFLNL
jgi:sulfite exporter TauE/SafE